MSKTYRKRIETYVEFYGGWGSYTWDLSSKTRKYCRHYWNWPTIIGFVDYDWESYKEDESKYYTDNYGQNFFRKRKPKAYRKMVNRARRMHDKRELWKETHMDYDGLYSKWNCRDSDPTWYW